MREFVVVRERLLNEKERDLTMAWHMAALSRAKTMPTLPTLIDKLRDGMITRPQTPQQQASVLQQMAEGYGLKMSRRGKKRHGKR